LQDNAKILQIESYYFTEFTKVLVA